MSELISADAALKELLCGKRVERCYKSEWEDLTADDPIDVFFTSESFRLKPRTITINGIEVPAPDYIQHGRVGAECSGWYIDIGGTYFLYKNRKDYDAVVAALRSIFNPK